MCKDFVQQLSKSRYVSGRQCLLRLWYECYEAQLAQEPDENTLAIFDVGNRIGELARERYPGGVLVDISHTNPEEAISITQDLIKDTDVKHIFEGAFLHDDVIIRADILERVDGDNWNLLEVKSGTKVKPVHEDDVAIQHHVLTCAGLKLDKVFLMTLNRDYVYDGKALNLDYLFRVHDLTEVSSKKGEEIKRGIDLFQEILSKNKAPEVEPGKHCHKPYDCQFFSYCTKDIVSLENPITELPRLSGKKAELLLSEGIECIESIPEDFKLTALQERIRNSVCTKDVYVSSELNELLQDVTYPVYYLDFETCMSAIPYITGKRPYDSVPFQFSIHVMNENGDVHHREFLHTENDDPSPHLAKRLIEVLGDTGSICCYSPYEATTIKNLINDIPELKGELESILPRLWDILPIIKNNFYHPDFHGSFSIKKVLPALVTELKYDDLDIKDGLAAGRQYLKYLDLENEDEREGIYQALKEYCGLDTFAIVKLREALLSISG